MKKNINYKFQRNIYMIKFLIMCVIVLFLLFYFIIFPTMKFDTDINYINLNQSQKEEGILLIKELKFDEHFDYDIMWYKPCFYKK